MSRAFVFPGQGAQTIGMGKALADAYPEAKAVFDEVDEEKESGTKTNGTRELESRGHMKASGRDGEESESVVHSRGKPSTCE